MKCPLCRKSTEVIVCDSCWSVTIERLSTFLEGYQALEKELVPSKSVDEKVKGTKTPPIPVKLEILFLRTTGISEPLLKHEIAIRKAQRHSEVAPHRRTEYSIAKSCEYIKAQRDWIKQNYADIYQLVLDVARINKSINGALGYRSELVSIGTCPAIDEQGDTCGYRLQVNPVTISNFNDIVCPSCHTAWESTRWRMLGRMLDDNDSRSHEVL